MVRWGRVGWGGAKNVPWHLHLVCVTVINYAATLANVGNVREHKFHGRSIFLFAKLADALGATLASGLCCGQKNMLLLLQMLLTYVNISFMGCYRICCYAFRCLGCYASIWFVLLRFVVAGAQQVDST